MFVKSYVHDDFAAEDIVAESLLNVWNVLKYEQINNVSSLLFTILKNKSLDYLRAQKRKLEHIKNMEQSEQWELNFRIATLEECSPKQIFLSEIEDIVRKVSDELALSQTFVPSASTSSAR